VNRSVSFSDISSSNNADDFSTDRPWHRDRRFRALPTFSCLTSIRLYLPRSLFETIVATSQATETMATAQIVAGKPQKSREFIAKAFKKVALIPHLRDRWLTCETWASAINSLTTEGIDVDVNSGTVSGSLSRDEELKAHADRYKLGENDTGYFKVEFKRTKFYYVCNPGDHIERPKLTKSWPKS
jgi:hypothetical protein